MISLYDTATRSVKPLKLKEDGKISIYVCGPTVYDAPHIGHGRFVLVYDVFRRFLIWKGLEVNFVSNITDIDDKIIHRAEQEGSDIFTIAKHWEEVWWETMDRLNIMRPDVTPHATEYVDQMVKMIEELIVKESAYVTSDGVYLNVEGIETYGLLANQDLDDLLEGGGDREVVGTEKKHPADFALWKFSKEGEPSWPSPWGEGRPGWHTECVVMSLDILGEGFDLHTGGLDLKFPHHENERAQALALGKEFANHWMHNGFVESGGQKMGKSLGNTKNLIEVCDSYDPRAYRLLILQTHYRSPIEVTDSTLENSVTALDRIDSLLRRSKDLDLDSCDTDEQIISEFSKVLENDFDTVTATDILFSTVRDANSAIDAGHAETAATLCKSLMIMCEVFGIKISLDEQIPEDIQELSAQRQVARDSKDFELADQLRDQLTQLGWQINDSDSGPSVWKQKF